MTKNLPYLVTFDGEARSGKGTRVQAVKDYLRDRCGYKVMLIDRGQTFRVLVVAAKHAGVNLDDASAIDAFLDDEQNIVNAVAYVKAVYNMPKVEREALLYTSEVSEDSAKVGARPSSQAFVRNLTKKWVHDADSEGFDVILLDGRALEPIARELEREGLCRYRLGLYFICGAEIGALRTLKLIGIPRAELTAEQRHAVTVTIEQIVERNRRDQERPVERLVAPLDAKVYRLPDVPRAVSDRRQMAIIDTSAELPAGLRSRPLAEFIAATLAGTLTDPRRTSVITTAVATE